MDKQEFNRLMSYYHAQRLQRQHMNHKPSKRSVKGNGSGTGQILKHSRIYSVDKVTLMECNS